MEALELFNHLKNHPTKNVVVKDQWDRTFYIKGVEYEKTFLSKGQTVIKIEMV